MNNARFEKLLIAYEDAALTPEDLAEFKQFLAHSPPARQRLVESGVMQNVAATHVMSQTGSGVNPQKTARWLVWRPLTAAAAGIVLGMFCSSAVLAFVAPMLGKAVTLLDESFESAPAPLATGVPTEAGGWSGDFAEIVGGQNGVAPHGGAKMWRFLRADNAVDAGAQASYVGEAIRIVDLQSLRGRGVRAGSPIELSAWFAAGQTVPGARYHWNLKVAAFEGSLAEAPKLWGKWAEACTSLVRREVPLEQAGQWQRLSVTMSLPANADFLVFECAVVQRRPLVSEGVAQFPAHYLDDVQVRVLPPTRDTTAQE